MDIRDIRMAVAAGNAYLTSAEVDERAQRLFAHQETAEALTAFEAAARERVVEQEHEREARRRFYTGEELDGRTSTDIEVELERMVEAGEGWG